MSKPQALFHFTTSRVLTSFYHTILRPPAPRPPADNPPVYPQFNSTIFLP